MGMELAMSFAIREVLQTGRQIWVLFARMAHILSLNHRFDILGVICLPVSHDVDGT
jgi:hypothetical protein